VCTVGCFTDGHGRGPRPRTSHGRGPRGARCAGLTFAAELSVHVPASARCPAGFPGRGGRGRAGAVMARVAVRESVTLAGRAERARAARAFVSEILGPGHPCGDVAILLVRDLQQQHPAQPVLCSRGDGHGRGHLRRRHCPGRDHRPSRTGDAGAASCRPRRGRRSRASARRGPRGAVGLAAAARRADGDLVRAIAPLLMSPPGDWPEIYLGCTLRRAKVAMPARCGAGRRRWLPGQVHGRLGRAEAPCRDCSRWVSPAPPPHPACDSHRTGRSMCLGRWISRKVRLTVRGRGKVSVSRDSGSGPPARWTRR
jgi:hypothetical protein